MKEILNEWRILEENMNNYLAAKNLIFNWVKKKSKPYKGMVHKEPKVVEAARIVISDDNKKYWHIAGGRRDAIWKIALAIASLNASAETSQPTVPRKLMRYQRDTEKAIGLRVPFLDPSRPTLSRPPKWANKWGKWTQALYAFTQTSLDIFADTEAVLLLILTMVTGGFGPAALSQYPALAKLLGRVASLLKMESAAGAAAMERIAELTAKSLIQLSKLRGKTSLIHPRRSGRDLNAAIKFFGNEVSLEVMENAMNSLDTQSGKNIIKKLINDINDISKSI